MSKFPDFEMLRPDDVLNDVKAKAHLQAYLFLKTLDKYKLNLQLATAESLTAGLIFSTIVDIPFGGKYKYGSFGVYDTDAKRIFLNVEVNDVYTHKCAKEMAVGVLKNSNATIAIVVTGNAMPYQGLNCKNEYDEEEIKKLGEVFIGVAGYTDDNTITAQTYQVKMCDKKKKTISNYGICDFWINKVINDGMCLKDIKKSAKTERYMIEELGILSGFNNFLTTSIISNIISYRTVQYAYEKAIEFINTYCTTLMVPDWIQKTRIDTNISKIKEMMKANPTLINNIMLKGDRNKLNIICPNKECDDDIRVYKKLFTKKNTPKTSSQKYTQVKKAEQLRPKSI